MTNLAAAAADPVPESSALGVVKHQVGEVLAKSQAFQNLPHGKRQQILEDASKVAGYIAGVPSPKASSTPAEVFSGGGGRREDNFDRGVDAFGDAIDRVNFPNFVKELVDGVFNAVVDASIRQMEAFAELVANVSKSVDQYMKDNVTEDQARDSLLERYPDHLEADLEAGRLKVRPDTDRESPPNFMEDLGLPFPIDLDDDEVEEALVPEARKRLAMDRQQLLATMVLMGLNRIVVTDGSIRASVVFDLDISTLRERHYQRDTSFDYNTKNKGKAKYKKKRRRKRFSYEHSWERDSALNVTTNYTSDTEDEIKLAAKLTGNVDLRFKTETFPLEKMTELLGLNQEKVESRAGTNRQPRTQPSVPLPPSPPLPV